MRVLPTSTAESVAAIRQVMTAQTGLASAAPDPEVTAVLVRASAARRRVRVTYRMREQLLMELDPWAVSVWRGRWYLLAWSHTSGARRVLRVDRVTTAVVLDEGFSPPDELDPIAAIEDQMSIGWRYDVEVVVDAPVDAVARFLPRSLGRLEALDGGRTRLVGSTDEPHWYARHLTAIQAPYRILSPTEVRDAARDLAKRLTRAAGPAGSGRPPAQDQSPSSSPTSSSRPKKTADSRALGVPASGSAPPATSTRMVPSSSLNTAPASGV